MKNNYIHKLFCELTLYSHLILISLIPFILFFKISMIFFAVFLEAELKLLLIFPSEFRKGCKKFYKNKIY